MKKPKKCFLLAGVLKQDFGDFGQLRVIKKTKEIFYIPTNSLFEDLGPLRKLRSIVHAPTGLIEAYIKTVGRCLQPPATIGQENAEICLDLAYQELHKRVNGEPPISNRGKRRKKAKVSRGKKPS